MTSEKIDVFLSELYVMLQDALSELNLYNFFTVHIGDTEELKN